VAGASYFTLVIFLARVSGGHLPQSGRDLLDYILRHGLVVQGAMAVFILKDMCILIAFPILAMLLDDLRPSLWVATVIASVGMLLDILSGLIVIAFTGFAGTYALAGPSGREAYLAIAEFVFRYVWRVETPLIVGLLSIAVVAFSRAMPAGKFGRMVKTLGVVFGILGIVGALFGLIQTVLLISIWYIAVGLRLVRDATEVTPEAS
jgi:hypothetical protein